MIPMRSFGTVFEPWTPADLEAIKATADSRLRYSWVALVILALGIGLMVTAAVLLICRFG